VSPSQFRRIDEVCDKFEAAWKRGDRPRFEEYLARSAREDEAALLGENAAGLTKNSMTNVSLPRLFSLPVTRTWLPVRTFRPVSSG